MTDLVKALSERLQDGSYNFTQYRELLSSKGAGKAPRVLSVPTARDRIALRALAGFLGEVFPYARGVIPQFRVEGVRNSLAADGHDFCVRLDVKSFYPSIEHELVDDALRSRIRKPEILRIVSKAIATPTVPDGSPRRALESRGVPQGLAISNILSELVAAPVDQIFTTDSRCSYFRFVDDILILCNSADAGDLTASVRAQFRDRGLKLHESDAGPGKASSGPATVGFEYLGYVFRGDRISVRPTSVKKIESSLARSFTRYRRETTEGRNTAALRKCQRLVNLSITGCIYKGIARGWIHYFRQMNDVGLAKRLDATVERFKRRFEMPPEFKTKTFTRSYWEAQNPRRSGATYIPTYDNLSTDDKRAILADLIGPHEVERMGDLEVERRFGPAIDRLVSDLERDIGSIY